jgi:hypothetical protein
MTVIRILVLITISLALGETGLPRCVTGGDADCLGQSCDQDSGPAHAPAALPASFATSIIVPPALLVEPLSAISSQTLPRPAKGAHCFSHSGSSPPNALA